MTCSDKALCAYAGATAAPFLALNVGLPTVPAYPSRKHTSRIRGSFTIGTAGVGFVAAQPNPSTDVSCVWYTGSTYAGTSITDSATGVTALVNPTGIATNASFGLGLGLYKQRCALGAIRIRYTGTELNRGGTVVPCELPNHTSLVGATQATVLAGEPSVATQSVGTEWHYLRFIPFQKEEYEYAITSYTTAGLNFGFLVNSTAGNTFEYDIVFHHEVIGVQTSQTNTPGSSGTLGYISNLVVNGYHRLTGTEGIGRYVAPVVETLTNRYALPVIMGAMAEATQPVYDPRLPIDGVTLVSRARQTRPFEPNLRNTPWRALTSGVAQAFGARIMDV